MKNHTICLLQMFEAWCENYECFPFCSLTHEATDAQHIIITTAHLDVHVLNIPLKIFCS